MSRCTCDLRADGVEEPTSSGASQYGARARERVRRVRRRTRGGRRIKRCRLVYRKSSSQNQSELLLLLRDGGTATFTLGAIRASGPGLCVRQPPMEEAVRSESKFVWESGVKGDAHVGVV